MNAHVIIQNWKVKFFYFWPRHSWDDERPSPVVRGHAQTCLLAPGQRGAPRLMFTTACPSLEHIHMFMFVCSDKCHNNSLLQGVKCNWFTCSYKSHAAHMHMQIPADLLETYMMILSAGSEAADRGASMWCLTLIFEMHFTVLRTGVCNLGEMAVYELSDSWHCQLTQSVWKHMASSDNYTH